MLPLVALASGLLASAASAAPTGPPAGLERDAIDAVIPLGPDDLVFRVRLGNGSDRTARWARLVVATRARPRAHLRAFAAHRLAAALAPELAPRAVRRAVAPRVLRSGLEPELADAWPAIEAELGVGDDGLVPATLIEEPAALRALPVTEAAGPWRGWLGGTDPIPTTRRPLVADLSTLALLDYLLGIDRVAEDVVPGRASGRRLALLDHGRAFPSSLEPAVEARLRDRMARVRRFSRTFVWALARLPSETRDPFIARLDPAAREAWTERLGTVRSYVAATIAAEPGSRALALP